MVGFMEYAYVQVGADVIMIVAYVATLIKVLRSSKFKFVIKLLALLIVSNLAGILTIICDGFADSAWVWALSISAFVRSLMFNLAYWMFAFQYYTISRYTPFLLR